MALVGLWITDSAHMDMHGGQAAWESCHTLRRSDRPPPEALAPSWRRGWRAAEG